MKLKKRSNNKCVYGKYKERSWFCLLRHIGTTYESKFVSFLLLFSRSVFLFEFSCFCMCVRVHAMLLLSLLYIRSRCMCTEHGMSSLYAIFSVYLSSSLHYRSTALMSFFISYKIMIATTADPSIYIDILSISDTHDAYTATSTTTCIHSFRCDVLALCLYIA